MKVSRPGRTAGVRISLVAMVDVLMIMLVFFMVTSTYLDLDMVPLAGADAAGGAASGADGAIETARLMVLIDAAGRTHFRGRQRDAAELGPLIAEERTRTERLEVLLLPSGGADVQALASAMDALVGAGVTELRVVRIEGQP